ncbi:MAG: TIGR01244 family sulfur transferase [Telluria sp.]
MKPSISRRILHRVIVATVALACSVGSFTGAAATSTLPSLKISALTDRLAVSGQVNPDQIAELKALGYTTIVALRPDGEQPDQPSAGQISEAARRHGMTFAYVPVQSGAIPDAAVTALDSAILGNSEKVLMYCRTGSRAARAWSLAEASRPGGADTETILAKVSAGGQSADDMRTAIAARVAARPAK